MPASLSKVWKYENQEGRYGLELFVIISTIFLNFPAVYNNSSWYN